MYSWQRFVAAVVVVGATAGCSASSTPRSTGSAGASIPSTVAPVEMPTPSAVAAVGKVVAKYSTFAGPLSFTGGRLYVSNGLDGQQRLEQVDPATGRLSSPVRTPPAMAYQVAAGPGVLWLTHPEEEPLSPPQPITGVNLATHKVMATLTEPNSYAAAVVGNFLWALDEAHDRVNKIDPATGRIVMKVATGLYPFCIDYAFGSLWVGNHHGNTISRIDPNTGKVLETIGAGPGPGRITDGGGSIWVADWDGDSVTRIDPRTNKAVATIHVTGLPNAVAFAAGAVWLFDPETGVLSRIDPQTRSVVGGITLATGDMGSYAIAADGYLWLSIPGTATFKIDPAK
ncbi:MAG TPA: YncE family protein [Mycobacterium sp.]|jgi:YVTN family beta-propeller protein|nr:YncE family protein [Mycobacterium sp.]